MNITKLRYNNGLSYQRIFTSFYDVFSLHVDTFIYLKLSPFAVLIFRLTRQRFSADNVFIKHIGACNGAINVICVTCSLKYCRSSTHVAFAVL